MNEPLGLRERKKEQTRQLIAETARRLFVERGFEQVTVAQIARAADVAEQTVYNYFPTKEDLVYWRLESFEQELLAAIRDRAPGVPVLEAFWQWMLRARGLMDEQPVSETLAAIARVIDESPALRVREQQVFERYTASLADLLAADTGAQPGGDRALGRGERRHGPAPRARPLRPRPGARRRAQPRARPRSARARRGSARDARGRSRRLCREAAGVDRVGRAGLEPATLGLKVPCSTN